MRALSDKITVEKMVGYVAFLMGECDRGHEQGCHGCDLAEQCITMLQAIRKHLTESDIAHWMDRCYELEAKLAEKPEPVSRDDIDKLLARIYGAAGEYRGNKIVEIWLTELDIEVSDNSEVRRRTSDKEGE